MRLGSNSARSLITQCVATMSADTREPPSDDWARALGVALVTRSPEVPPSATEALAEALPGTTTWCGGGMWDGASARSGRWLGTPGAPGGAQGQHTGIRRAWGAPPAAPPAPLPFLQRAPPPAPPHGYHLLPHFHLQLCAGTGRTGRRPGEF